MKNILELSRELNIPNEMVIPYGWDKAKIDLTYLNQLKSKPNGKLVLVTAITPTKAGEGKTTTSIGLHDGLHSIGVNSMLCLREGSLGPVFGVKGNCVGNGKSVIVPEKSLSLHFTGDFHALTSAINLISAVIENHIYQGNELNINPEKILWKRALDMNDRSLRSITVAKDDKKAIPHNSEFVITVASELMSTACMADSLKDFKDKVNKILIAYTYDNKPVYLKDLKMSDSIVLLMEEALKPNLVQTGEGNPCLVHLGPFCNISFGCNSFNATRLGLKLSDVCITEAGFGADLGMEKFCDITCQTAGLKPDAVVIVATIKGLKLHGGQAFEDLAIENVTALSNGICNLEKHIENVAKYKVPFIIAINRFEQDTDREITWLVNWCRDHNYKYGINTAVKNGGPGAADLAKTLMDMLESSPSEFTPLYSYSENNYVKIEKICKEIYGADEVIYSDEAKRQLDKFIELGYDKCAICIAKTPNSLTDDPKLLGRPENFAIHIKEVRLAASCNMLIPMAGSVMMMPGLNKNCKALDEFAQLAPCNV